MLEEAVQIVHGMWTTPETTFKGQYYEVARANCDPRARTVDVRVDPDRRRVRDEIATLDHKVRGGERDARGEARHP